MSRNETRTHLRGEHVIYAEDMTRAYGKRVVLDDIDLAISEGELVTLVGPSGSGKTTLLRLLLGQDRHTTGTLLLDGDDVPRPDPTRGIVYQEYSVFPHMTVLDNVLFGLQMRDGGLLKFLMNPKKWWHKRKANKAEAMRLLERFGLKGYEKAYPDDLSGGQKQRVAIAAAIIRRPRLLLMDEAFKGLDEFTREDIQMFLLELWKEANEGEGSMTIIFITHGLGEAVFLGSRVIGLSQFVTDGRGQNGARIAFDFNLGRKIKSPEVRSTPEFGRIIADIKQMVMRPEHRQHVATFAGNHPDSFITLTDAQRQGAPNNN